VASAAPLALRAKAVAVLASAQKPVMPVREYLLDQTFAGGVRIGSRTRPDPRKVSHKRTDDQVDSVLVKIPELSMNLLVVYQERIK
jgi:hypothetical protein